MATSLLGPMIAAPSALAAAPIAQAPVIDTPVVDTPAPAVVAPVQAVQARPTFGTLRFSAVAKPKPAPAPAPAPAAGSDPTALAQDRTQGTASRSTPRTSRVSGTGLSGLTATATTVLNAVLARYGQITNVIGVRPDSLPDHPSGHAIDFMIPDWSSTSATGDAVAAYVIANAGAWNVDYIIWRQRIWQNGAWRSMSDRGSPTANHMDHVHVTVG